MPIYFEDRLLEGDNVNLFTLISQFPGLKHISKDFLLKEKVEVAGANSLYVDQREYAALTTDDTNLSIIGSDDATTCHIVIARHTGSGVTVCGHFDGCGTDRGVTDMLQLLEDLSSDCYSSGQVQVHLFGGFLDDNGLSLQISNEIIGCLHRFPEKIHICHACITEVNDIVKEENVHWPVIYGIACDVPTGELFQASFSNRGPDALLRSARHLTGSRTMVNIYDNKKRQLVIGPFQYRTVTNGEVLLQLPDEQIKQYLSTSPQQEPECFSARIKDTIRYAMCHPYKDVFKENKARVYYRANSSWNRLVN